MGLIVRLRHPLGERVLELPERGVDNPVVVGRSGGADIQIPSINVGQRHLVLFRHEGRWVAQNGPDSTGTTLNGSPMPGVCVLHAGDVMVMGAGADAPTIEVDADADVTSSAPPVHAAMPTRPAAAPMPSYGFAPPPVPPALARPPQSYAPASPPAEAHASPVAVEEPGDWMTPVASTQTYFAPRQQKSSGLAVIAAILLTILIGGGVAWFVFKQRTKPPQQVVSDARPAPKVIATSKPAPRSVLTEPPPPPGPVKMTPKPPENLADELDDPATRPSKPSEDKPTRVAAPEIPDSPIAEREPDKAAQAMSPEAKSAFDRVEKTYWNTDPAKCLLAIDSFEEEFPGIEKPKMDQYREDMLDKAWWLRIDSLLDKQKKLQDDIKKTEIDIQRESEAAFKKTVLEPRLEDQKVRLEKVSERLTKEMRYKGTASPPIGDEPKLARFRTERDTATYDSWKTRVLKFIRDHHGAYPWAGER